MHRGRKCTGSNELPDARPDDAPKGTSPGLGGGVNAFFCIVSCWQGVKIRKGWLKLRSFQRIRGSYVPAAKNHRTLGWAMRRKARRLALAEA